MDYGESWVPHISPPEPKRTDVACQFPSPLEIEPPSSRSSRPSRVRRRRDPLRRREEGARPNSGDDVVKKQVVVTTTQNAEEVDDAAEREGFRGGHRSDSRKGAQGDESRTPASAPPAAEPLPRAIRESSDFGPDDVEVGTDARKEQQESAARGIVRPRRLPSCMTCNRSARSARSKRLRVEHERATREKREALEKKRSGVRTQTVAEARQSGGDQAPTKIEEGE